MIPKIMKRAFFYTLWRHPRTFKVFWHFKKNVRKDSTKTDLQNLLSFYPAHLHIDILSEYQRQGIGTSLIDRLEKHLRFQGIKGVHSGTSERNSKAIQFYKKVGFSMIYEEPGGFGMWPDAPEVRGLIFAKKVE
jgi:GNAT superfamily N-acetyltransferase